MLVFPLCVAVLFFFRAVIAFSPTLTSLVDCPFPPPDPPTTSPSSRTHFASVSALNSTALFLFGGEAASSPPQFYGDLWNFAYNDSLAEHIWQISFPDNDVETTESCPGRLSSVLMFECPTNTSSLCLFGGDGENVPSSVACGDLFSVWNLEEHRWVNETEIRLSVSQAATASPSCTFPRRGSSIARMKSPAAGGPTSVVDSEVFIFGGASVGKFFSESGGDTEEEVVAFELLSGGGGDSPVVGVVGSVSEYSPVNVPGWRVFSTVWVAVDDDGEKKSTVYVFGGRGKAWVWDDFWAFREGEGWSFLGGLFDPFLSNGDDDDYSLASCGKGGVGDGDGGAVTPGFYSRNHALGPAARESAIGFWCADEIFCLFGGRMNSPDIFPMGALWTDLWIFHESFSWMLIDSDWALAPHAGASYVFEDTRTENGAFFIGLGSSVDALGLCGDFEPELGDAGRAWPFAFADQWRMSWDATNECNGFKVWEEGACSAYGKCEDGGTCLCDDFHDGTSCEIVLPICDGLPSLDPLACGPNGNCVADGMCSCIGGTSHYGEECDEFIDPKSYVYSQANPPYVKFAYRLSVEKIVPRLLSMVNSTFALDLILSPASSVLLGNASSHAYFELNADKTATTAVIVVLGGSEATEETILAASLSVYVLTDPLYPNVTATATVSTETPYSAGKDPFNVGKLLLDIWPVYILAAVAIALVVLGLVMGLLICCYCCTHRRRKEQYLNELFKSEQQKKQVLHDEADLKDPNFESLNLSRERMRNLFKIRFDDLTIVRLLNAGNSAAVVYEVVYREQTCVLKLFRTKDISYSQQAYDTFEAEVKLLMHIPHPHLLDFYGCTLSVPRIGILVEFCPNGDLKSHIMAEENDRIPLRGKLRILRDVAATLEFLNEREIVHRDLKPENVLLTKEMVPKLIDFGLSRVIEGGSQSAYISKQSGASQYLAPEVTMSSKISLGCDVFSYAIMMYEVLTEDFDPYGDCDFNIELKVALNPEFRPDYTDEIVDDLEPLHWYRDLMIKNWQGNPQARASFKEIKEIFDANMEATVAELEPPQQEEDSS